ncbi:MAG: NUDIX hydrolase [Treponema sp.]|nr:NUDIX hydrolase [Treponema sp.]
MNDDKLKWTEKSTKTLLKTVVFDVTERHSASSDGLEGDYIVVNARDWVIVVPVLGQDFLMVKQWRHGEKALSIEFPGGVAEAGEPFEYSARRELLEETGYEAGRMTELAVFNPNPALFSNHVHVYLAEDLKKTSDQKLDEDEYVDFLQIPQKEVIAKMGSSEYSHGLMLSALGLYLAKINK